MRLSEQNLIDCTSAKRKKDGAASVDSAFRYVISTGGIDTEEYYPYDGSVSFSN